MKKTLSAVLLLSFALFPFDLDIPNIPAIDYVQEIPEITKSSFATYSDENFSQEEVNFAPGQAIFVKAGGPAQDVSAQLAVLAEDRSIVLEFNLAKAGEDYTGNFTAPDSVGTYYVHLEMKGEGFSFSAERNVNILGEKVEQNEQSVQVKVKAVSDSTNEQIDESGEVLSSKTPTDRPKSFNLLKWLGNLISKLFSIFTTNT